MSWFIFVELPVLFAEYFIIFTFYKDFLGLKNRHKLLWEISAILFISIYRFSDLHIQNFAVKLIITAIVCFSLSLLFDGNIKLKLLSAFLYFVFIFVSDAVVYYCILLVCKVDPKLLLQEGIFAIIGFVISKLLILVIAKLSARLRNKDNTHISFQYWLSVAIFPVFSLFILFVLFDVSKKFNITETSTIALSAVAVVGVLLFNIISFNLFEYFTEKTARELREILLRRQVSAHIKENERLQYEFISKKSFYHDLRHNIQLLYDLIKNNNNDDALKLISKMSDLNYKKGKFVLTGSPAINALFNSHLGYAESHGIKIITDKIHLPAGVELDIADICTIFSNSIENAIEACLKIEESKRYIEIALIYQDEKLVCKITNPTNGNVIKDKKGWYKSTKSSPGEHGIGIENIDKAVSKYGGIFSATHEDNIFTLGFSISFMKRQIYCTDKIA